MKKLYLLFCLIKTNDKIIKNLNTSSCKNCIYFQPYRGEFDSDLSYISKCEKFGKKNIINDKITYEYADMCRMDESKCGIEGKYFVEEKNINLKIIKYKLLYNYHIYLFYIFFYLYGIYGINMLLK